MPCKLYIFGDSFSVNYGQPSLIQRFFEKTTIYEQQPSWIQQLSQKYKVRNFSEGGYSNSHIFLKFVENIDSITSNDFVIIGWSDVTRPYADIKMTQKLRELYMEYFYSHRLHREHSKMYMSTVKEILIKRNIPHLIFWSFPSYYDNGPSWTCRDLNNFVYCDEFANEIRPALIYFSRIELDSNLTVQEYIEYMGNDSRLNHVGNATVHNELFKIVVDVIDGKLSGMIDLKQRLDNVK